MSKPSHTDRRRQRLARRVAALETMEPRSMITESLFSLGLGLGTAATALVGSKNAGADRAIKSESKPIGDATRQPEAIPPPKAKVAAPGAGSQVGNLAAIPISANSSSDDWLSLSPATKSSPTLGGVPPVSQPQGGGALGSGGGSGNAAAIRPVRFSPPPDLSSASSSIIAAGGPASNATPGATSTQATPTVAATVSVGTSAPAPATAAPAGRTASIPSASLISGGGPLTATADPGIYTVTGGDTNVAKGIFTYYPLYTLDYNDGVVLFPGNIEVGTPGNNVDLRAQTRDTTGVTFSWTTPAYATGVTGTGTYNLKFQWLTSITQTSQTTTTLTATDVHGHVEQQTYTFILRPPAAGSGSGGGTTTWPESLAPNLLRPGYPAFDSHNASVDAASGAVDTAISLPSYNPNVAPIVLDYNSLAADPRPIVVEHHVLDDSKTTPTQVTASLTFNGTTGATSYYDTSQFIPGDVQQMALQVDATGLGTGRYSYTVNVGDVRGTTTSSTSSGTMTVLDESGNAFGAGWTLAGLEHITTATGGVILSLGGADRTLWFSGGGSGGGSYTSPAGEFSTLTSSSGGGGTTYTRTLPDGTVYRFDSGGKETSVADRNGLRVTYVYDGSNRLTTITDPYGNNTVLSYSSGLLATVTDPAGRVTTFTHSGTNLSGATLPDNGAWAYAYDGSHRLTTITDPNSHATVATYDSAERVGTITRPDATTETFVADQERGFVTGTSSGSPGAATLLAESKGSHTDPNGHTTDLRPDWRGMGLENQSTDPDGDVATNDRDSNGLATIAIDRINRFLTYTYDNKGNITGVTDADMNLATYTYNSLAEVTTAKDENGHTTSYTYDGNGNLTVIQDALNDLTTMTYTGNGRVATVKDPLSHTTSYQYDSQDRLTTITYPSTGGASDVTTIVNDSKGNVTTVIDERGNATTYSYDAMNRRTGTKDALGNRTTQVYDSGGNLTAVQSPLSRTTSYAYDAMDRIATVTDPLSHSTTITYDLGGNLRTVTDALGRTTTLAYDPEDRQTQVATPVSAGVTRTATKTYDAEGQVIQQADYMARITTLTYNARGWTETVTDPLGNVSTYTYSATGKPVTQSDPSHSGGTLISYGYDALDRLTTMTDALAHTNLTVYDSGGNVIATVDGNSLRTTYAYDARNRLTTVTDPLSHNTVYGYDSGGNRTSVTDPLSHATAYGFDALNRVTTITDAHTAVTTIAFDAAGREVGLTDPNGNRTTWAYDAADRMTTETAPVPVGQNGVSTYAYDNANQLTDQTDRDGRRTTFAYDLAGRQVNERWLDASGGTVATITYTYDADNELTGAADPNATLTFTYDSGGRQTAAGTSGGGTGQPSVTLTYGYNQANERTSLSDSLASVGLITYQYDAAHRLTTISQSFGGTSGPQVVFGYDSGNRETSIARTIGGSGTEVDSTLAYDNANRLTTLVHQVNSGSVLASYAYAYDNANRLTTETYSNITVAYNYAVTYTYDATNELTAAGGSRTESYGYDSGGNRNTTGYTTATGNELAAAPGFTYTYDAEGNTTAQTETATGNVTTYSYDYRDRLTGATEKNSSGTVIMQATYTYDALNRRIGTDVDADGAGVGSPVQTWMVYDGQNIYADFNGAGMLQTRYLYGPSIDQILARTSSSGTTAWYLTDHLGSVRDITNISGGVIDHVSYDSFGVASETNAASGDRFKFAAREFDTSLGLYNLRSREYSSGSGRFLQRDTKGFGGGDTNVYRYAAGAATLYTDPLGTDSQKNDDGGPGYGSLYMYYLNPFNDDGSQSRGAYYAKWLGWSMFVVGGGGAAVLYFAGQSATLIGCTQVVKGLSQIACAYNSTKSAIAAYDQAATAIASYRKGDYWGALRKGAEASYKFYQAFTDSCFAAGTPIRTPDGHKPIELFRPGEYVLAAPEDDPEGAVRPRLVEQVFRSESTLVTVEVGGRSIRTTAQHPFWVVGRGWTEAMDLIAGDRLRSHDGRYVVVAGVVNAREVAAIYNMRVADDHTYFVGAVDWEFSVWAHNACFGATSATSQTGEPDIIPGAVFSPNNPGPAVDWLDGRRGGMNGLVASGGQQEAQDMAQSMADYLGYDPNQVIHHDPHGPGQWPHFQFPVPPGAAGHGNWHIWYLPR